MENARPALFILTGLTCVLSVFSFIYFKPLLLALVVLLPILYLGYEDIFQTRQTIRRNFPIIGRFRYIFEEIRPEINQYFIESNTDGVPINREQRSLIYQRAKSTMDTLPFGTQRKVYDVGYEWLNHSMVPIEVDPSKLRVRIGGPACKKPYDSSLLNISAMSYGSLSSNAILALNAGAHLGGFAHNTGEGGLSQYHLEPGGDLIWQIGTGYFGCRDKHGKFNPSMFKDKASHENVKMIEIKLSQGAKPGHGGILPAKKLTEEIAEVREVPMGKDVISPPAHSTFSNPMELMEFIQQLRDLSGGKPVGIKFCLGKRREFFSLCKAMIKTGIKPDFIAVDGGEGGTGAAPLEFSNHVGYPGIDALIFVRNVLTGYDLKKDVKIITSGRIITGFDIVKRLCLGADLMYSARAMMFALGCIQALRCNANVCPTGIATQNKRLTKGLVVSDKKHRVSTFHKETIESAAHLMGAMGISDTSELRPWHIFRRTSPTEVKNFNEIFNFLKPGCLNNADIPSDLLHSHTESLAESFTASDDLNS